MGESWKRGGYLGAVVGALIALTLTAGHAQDSTFLYRIDPGESLKIDRHSECRIVSNNGTSPVMVSTGTPAEWVIGTYAFLRNLGPMRGVTVNVCPGPGDPVVRKWALKAEDIYFTEFIEPCTAADRTTYLIGTTCDVASWNVRYPYAVMNNDGFMYGNLCLAEHVTNIDKSGVYVLLECTTEPFIPTTPSLP